MTKKIDIEQSIKMKINFFHDIIQNTILHVKRNKTLNILTTSELHTSVSSLCSLRMSLNNINENDITDNIINNLQQITSELSTLFKKYGTYSLDDLLLVCFGNNTTNSYAISDIDKQKFTLLKKYFHPISYIVLEPTQVNISNNDKLNTDELNSKSKNLECANILSNTTNFYMKLLGMRMVIHSINQNKTLIITGLLDDIMTDSFPNNFLISKKTLINENIPSDDKFTDKCFHIFMESLNIKDYFINEPHEIYLKFMGDLSNLNNIKQKSISTIIKDFLSSDLYVKRIIIIQLLLKSEDYDNQYLAYLLYDLLSNDANNVIDTAEQQQLFDSLPMQMKQYFKDAMTNTIKYTNELTNFDTNKIPLEQQICLLKVNESVKEKAMQKLKEVKAKSEDSGSKARQYLDGLLKIPFNIYLQEPIMHIMDEIKDIYKNILCNYKPEQLQQNKIYTNIEIIKSVKQIKQTLTNKITNVDNLVSKIGEASKKDLCIYIDEINKIIKQQQIKVNVISKNKNKNMIVKFLKEIINNDIIDISHINNIFKINNSNNQMINITTSIQNIENKYLSINKYLLNVKNILDKSVHGHNEAKRQIERIIGQWINGKMDGHCFGFEGPPGVGKTSLAKYGLSKCLENVDGKTRPFSMIQMGGDANGSVLHGHSYTYVGSTWGSIVQILIDTKCMNPIIFIDELDKVSKTNHGNEIIGILTHLLDQTQNDKFQDKYFSGIDLDLSKALFIISYNDENLIDRVLLDRIHRIRFKNLTLEDKKIISRDYILPEIYSKMGLENIIMINDNVIEYIITKYTCEPGVRKLKEILFEIIGEINIEILKDFDNNYEIPIQININDVKNKYFKDKRKVKHTNIHSVNKVGIINGLWANSIGQGGVIPIQSQWKTGKFGTDLKLTGMQGDVMKESMNVAQTLATSLTDKKHIDTLCSSSNNINGIHIHCPEGATPKDGPSAGTAITVAIYSLINNLPIPYNIAITGEITLDGKVTEIGGLDLKILGGIVSGIKTFIFPTENLKDYNDFINKYKETNEIPKDVTFINVSTIEEVLQIVFDYQTYNE